MGVSQEQSFYYFILIGTVIIFLLVTSIVFFFYIYQKRLYKQQQDMSAIIIRHQEELLYANWQMVEEERKRLSKEFHDDIGSIFSTLSLVLGSLESKAALDTQTSKTLQQSQQLIDSGVKNMRRILYDIVPPDIDIFGLSNTILILCERINSASKLHVSFQEKGTTSPHLNKKQELTLYRIIQELLNNTVKHAGAERADLEMSWANEELVIHYTDNGKGFDTSNVAIGKGLGLRNIESRAKMIHADTTFSNTADKGVRFILKLPIYAPHE
jgi:signal transduction histidine kinase